MQKQPRMAATTARGKRYGPASQAIHERNERMDRNAMVKRMASDKKAAHAAGAQRLKNKRKEKGANSGTIGGSRGSLAAAFFGK